MPEGDNVTDDDYSVRAVVATAAEPALVRTSPDGTTAFVATVAGGTCEVIDLTSGTRTIPGFSVVVYGG